MNNHLLHLLHLADPSLPIGAYAHSSGLETYVQAGIVHDTATAESFIREMLSRNILHTDAAYLSLAYEAAKDNDPGKLLSLDEECAAVKLPSEMRMASLKLGLRLLKLFAPLCKNIFLDEYASEVAVDKDHRGNYAVAFGVVSFTMQIPKADALSGFFFNALTGLVTNSVKLIPLGQQQGQEILFEMKNLIPELVVQAMQPDEAMRGLCSPALDIRSMQHEHLYSRLYMS